jgi:hypothetical protein
MKRLALAIAIAAAAALCAASASAQTYTTFQCSNSTVLRVIFNDTTATVVPFGRPSIRLTRAEANGDSFRYARRDSHELRGNMREVRWRTGSGTWTCRRVGR